MRVLTVNAGSSSLKLRLLGPEDEVFASHDLPADAGVFDKSRLDGALAGLDRVEAVAHRFVHGGPRHREAARLDDATLEELRDLVALAPIHQPAALAAAEMTGRALPTAPAIACFDTAFHAGLPAAAAQYALPAEWRERFGLRRYGFHGLSHAHAARRAAELAGAPLRRTVTCHLGAGASLAAVRDGRSVDTTMGFTPLEGLVMATRAGSVDPGLLLWLQRHGGLTAQELERALDQESGLQGLSGTSDMREVLARAERGDERARLGLDVYLHRLRAAIAAMAAALGGLEAIVFTGGVGEGAPAVRARCASGLGFLGIDLDAERNAKGRGDEDIGTQGARVRVFVVTAREDREMARSARDLLEARGL